MHCNFMFVFILFINSLVHTLLLLLSLAVKVVFSGCFHHELVIIRLQWLLLLSFNFLHKKSNAGSISSKSQHGM